MKYLGFLAMVLFYCLVAYLIYEIPQESAAVFAAWAMTFSNVMGLAAISILAVILGSSYLFYKIPLERSNRQAITTLIDSLPKRGIVKVVTKLLLDCAVLTAMVMSDFVGFAVVNLALVLLIRCTLVVINACKDCLSDLIREDDKFRDICGKFAGVQK